MTIYSIPENIERERVKIVMICDAPPENKADYFYAAHGSLAVVNTINAFNNAGIKVENMDDISKMGVYLTVAIKTPRKSLTIPSQVIKEHSHILEEELNAFPNIVAILLMGDAAIKSMNYISLRTTGKKVIPDGSTYKIRSGKFYYKRIRVFPSYLQTGRNFLIEKAKQRMVAEDIRNALKLIQN